MATTTTTTATTTRRLFPVITASVIGTTIEWYDYFLYATVAVLVFPHLFFPKESVMAGTLLSLTTFLVGFIARPFGSVLFGHLGDRLGRKSTLVATVLLMGIATFLIGFVPGYDTIGIAAPLLVSVLRFCQGLGVGGEWGGAILLALEQGHPRNRGFWASWPQIGAPLGLFLSSVAVSIVAAFSGPQFPIWGWRIPFYLSALLIVVGLFIRLRLEETPLFAKVREEKQEVRLPVVDMLKFHWKDLLLILGAGLASGAAFYTFATFVLVYGVHLGLDRQLVLTSINVACILEAFTIPLSGAISDRVGRRLWYLAGCIVLVVFPIPYFFLLNTKVPALVLLAIILSFALYHGWIYGVTPAFYAEHFSTKVRYTGTALALNLLSPLTSGLAPLIATALLVAYPGSYMPLALYLIILAVISAVATLGLKELSHADISA
ncbi:MAG: MHS family MFS transporter [Chloroflexi bacterium]|nr:MHS family MFS transporter [Chloroflexota bacterium]